MEIQDPERESAIVAKMLGSLPTCIHLIFTVPCREGLTRGGEMAPLLKVRLTTKKYKRRLDHLRWGNRTRKGKLNPPMAITPASLAPVGHVTEITSVPVHKSPHLRHARVILQAVMNTVEEDSCSDSLTTPSLLPQCSQGLADRINRCLVELRSSKKHPTRGRSPLSHCSSPGWGDGSVQTNKDRSPHPRHCQ